MNATRHRLRGTDPTADLARLLDASSLNAIIGARFRPAVLLLEAGRRIGERCRAGRLDAALVPAMELPLVRLTEALGGCERIASTPIPFKYTVILHRTITLYGLLLPFGLVDAIGAMTPVVVVFVAYTFFALEALGDELEEPFGTAPNDLALDAMSAMIEAMLLELAGGPFAADAPGPVGYQWT